MDTKKATSVVGHEALVHANKDANDLNKYG
jgi:hypothetical protein